jgi:hypothetical protein
MKEITTEAHQELRQKMWWSGIHPGRGEIHNQRILKTRGTI